MKLKAVGHRVVHGGTYFSHPSLVTDKVIKEITQLIPFAPYHEPQSLEAIKNIQTIYPDMPQVVCFDTTFHRTQEKLATLFAIPRKLTNEGLVRYGFHGISYEYIASVITQQIGDVGNKRVIVAHLGNGASMCAMHQRKSVATSMGLTALDGLMMGARCGSIDPGLILYLLQEKKYSVEQVATTLYQESGLLGVSGISSDMRKLQSSTEPNAIEAVDLFCYFAARELGALCAQLQGCDAIIFTAGIGERSAIVRKKICERLKWLGVVLNEKANNSDALVISEKQSEISVGVIPTNEEYMIAKHTMDTVS
jgi:acetate kinase